jgi:UDP-N-acetylmuramoyl-tripeptide--D-alanyl-D-alanine ligase
MPLFDPRDLAAWTGGTWNQTPSGMLGPVVHDSREVVPGCLYVALKGERFDGHDFLAQVADTGAAGAVCARGRGIAGLACLEVDDPQRALEDLAREYRRTLGGLIVGVTGSAGKTTVKDLLAAILMQRGATCKTRGNWNNQIGLPLSVLSMEKEDDFGVFEAGMNHAGEIGHLCRILQPLCGLVTSIGEAHLEALGSVEAIAKEKITLLASLPEEGVGLVDLDSPWKDQMFERTRARIVTCSLRMPADYTGQPVAESAECLHIKDAVRGVEFEVDLPLPGKHMMRNVLQAVVVAREFGLSVDEIRAGVQAFAPAPMRWEKLRVGSWTVINDAYNANPLSMRSSIKTFARLEFPVEKWLVLGGMNELGAGEAQAHRDLGVFVASLGFHGVVTVGEKAAWIHETAQAGETVHADSVEEAAAVLRGRVGPGAGILVKASRGDRLERVISELQQHVKDEGN